MAAKKMLPGPSTTKSVLHAAKWLVPLLATGARWLSTHPEVWDGIKEQGAKLQKFATDRPDGVLKTVRILREQVDYLAASADDELEAQQAAEWAKRLDSCERAAQLLKAPGTTRKDRKALKKRIEALRTDIFAAYIEERGEDAETGRTPKR